VIGFIIIKCCYINDIHYSISWTAFVVLWSEFLATDLEARVRFPTLPEKSSGSGTGSTQPREYN
jgi:hypothetical protein